MKKLLIMIAIIAHNTLRAHDTDLLLGVPTTIQHLVNNGKKIVGIKRTPILCTNTRYFLPRGIAAATIINLNRYVFLFSQPKQKSIVQALIQKHGRLHGIAFNPKLFTQPYGIQRLVILHELYHLKQCAQTDDCITLQPHLYPRGIEQEACCQAIKLGNCRLCAQEYANFRLPYVTAQGHISYDEAHTLAQQIPSTSYCFYHHPNNNRIFKHIRALASLAPHLQRLLAACLKKIHQLNRKNTQSIHKKHMSSHMQRLLKTSSKKAVRATPRVAQSVTACNQGTQTRNTRR